MNRKSTLASLLIVIVSGTWSLAQNGPPPRDGDRPEPRDQSDRPGPPDRQGGPDRRGPMGRDGMDGPPRMREMNGPMGQVEVVRGYLDAVDRFSRLARDSSTSGIAAVISANEILKSRGQDAVVKYFTNLLPNVKNEAIQRAIRLQLMQAYQSSGQQDKALEQVEALIKEAPAGSPPEASKESR